MNLWLFQWYQAPTTGTVYQTWRVICTGGDYWLRYSADPRVIGYDNFDFQSRPWRNQVGP